jgi:hypothetical protein
VQTPRHSLVTPLICLDLLSPEFGVALGEVPTPTATVPETTIRKNRDLAAGPGKIWTAFNWPMFAISTQPRLPQYPAKGNFGAPVSSGAHGGHDFGSDLL